MPATVIPANMGVVTCGGRTGLGDQWNNVFAIDLSGAGGVTPTSVLSTVDDFFIDFYGSLATAHVLSTGFRLDKMGVKMNVTGGIGAADRTCSGGGAPGGTDMPPQVAIVVSWKTVLSGRSFRGRTYLGPVNRDCALSTGLIDPSIQTAIQTETDELTSALSEISMDLAVWSRTLNSFHRVTSSSIGNVFDTQRRRRSANPG